MTPETDYHLANVAWPEGIEWCPGCQKYVTCSKIVKEIEEMTLQGAVEKFLITEVNCSQCGLTLRTEGHVKNEENLFKK